MKPELLRRGARRAGLLLVALAVAACQPSHSAIDAQRSDADSIAIERSVCFGLCPAYRLTLQRNGAVHFVTTARRDTMQRVDTVAPRSVAWLARQAHRAGFYSLPRDVVSDKSLCPLPATDHPTVTVTIFRGDSTHSVIDYTGCYTSRDLTVAAPLVAMRRFENAIDSVAGAKRWFDLARPK